MVVVGWGGVSFTERVREREADRVSFREREREADRVSLRERERGG